MAYWQKTTETLWYNEQSFYCAGEYGARGSRRAKRRKATPAEIERANQRNREKRVQELIACNFDEGDIWLTLKHPVGERPGTVQEFDGEISEFVARVRYQYQKRGEKFKWILREEVGVRGGMHAHLVCNRIPDSNRIISDAWTRARGKTPIEDMLVDGFCPFDGMSHFEDIRRLGNGEQLAEYLCKELPPKEKYSESVELSDDDRKRLSRYRCSRGLKKPVVKKKKYSHWTMKRILDLGVEGINTPAGDKFRTPGYIVDKDTWVTGVCQYTGLTYLHYIEIPTRRGRWETEKKRRRQQMDADCTVAVRTAGTMKAGSAGSRRKN